MVVHSMHPGYRLFTLDNAFNPIHVSYQKKNPVSDAIIAKIGMKHDNCMINYFNGIFVW